MSKQTYSGKYRAIVKDINDPLKSGRIRVICPQVLGNSVSSWCIPCVPVAYDGGGDFAYPRIGETVFIEFEDSDLKRPIYTGNWFKEGQCPLPDYDPDKRVISWGNNKILMEKDKVTLTDGKNNVILKENDVELNAVNNVTVKGDSISIKGSNTDMNYKDGKAEIVCSYGKIVIDENGMSLIHENGSNVLLKGSSVDITSKTEADGSKSLSLTPAMIDLLNNVSAGGGSSGGGSGSGGSGGGDSGDDNPPDNPPDTPPDNPPYTPSDLERRIAELERQLGNATAILNALLGIDDGSSSGSGDDTTVYLEKRVTELERQLGDAITVIEMLLGSGGGSN